MAAGALIGEAAAWAMSRRQQAVMILMGVCPSSEPKISVRTDDCQQIKAFDSRAAGGEREARTLLEPR